MFKIRKLAETLSLKININLLTPHKISFIQIKGTMKIVAVQVMMIEPNIYKLLQYMGQLEVLNFY